MLNHNFNRRPRLYKNINLLFLGENLIPINNTKSLVARGFDAVIDATKNFIARGKTATANLNLTQVQRQVIARVSGAALMFVLVTTAVLLGQRFLVGDRPSAIIGAEDEALVEFVEDIATDSAMIDGIELVSISNDFEVKTQRINSDLSAAEYLRNIWSTQHSEEDIARFQTDVEYRNFISQANRIVNTGISSISIN
ncbi:MAG: hypothetical protein LBG64_00980, partial [Pseudomonadales bacterium]|nr:hypothetical protein [Pseudomonadales bacterium]